MARIRGIDVTLYNQTEVGRDPFNAPIYFEDSHPDGAFPSNQIYLGSETLPGTTCEVIKNVLVGQPTDDEIISSVSMYGKRIAFMLGIPKGDTHDWQEKIVEWTDAYGTLHRCKTFGFPITGIEANLPPQVPWHKKVRCEVYG